MNVTGFSFGPESKSGQNLQKHGQCHVIANTHIAGDVRYCIARVLVRAFVQRGTHWHSRDKRRERRGDLCEGAGASDTVTSDFLTETAGLGIPEINVLAGATINTSAQDTPAGE